MDEIAKSQLDREELAQTEQFLDQKEYQARFLLNPDLNYEDIDYKHFDKNLAITNLKQNRLYNEVEEVRATLKAIHVLNNPKYYKEVERKKLIGYIEQKQEDGSISYIPQYETELVKVSKFPKTYHNQRSRFLSYVNTAAARGGFRMNSAISNKLIKEETMTDKTEPKKSFFAGFQHKKPEY